MANFSFFAFKMELKKKEKSQFFDTSVGFKKFVNTKKWEKRS
jgi:hypothetical protein